MHGYAGKILKVDLTTGKIDDLPLEERLCRDFIGGSGLAARFFLDYFSPEVGPLDPQNPLIFMTGPLTGTRLPGCATRFSVASRSPLTGIWGESSCGGSLGHLLKAAGYDGILILGKAPKPQYLYIDEEKVELCDAASLWGKDTYQVVDELREARGEKVSVAAIGQAGENLVKYACIMNDKRNAAGRTGHGAVMGSKNLKAICAQGKGKVEFADQEKLAQLRKEVLDKIKESMSIEAMSAFGTDSAMDLGMMTGDVPIKNWQKGIWDEGSDRLSGPTMADSILTKRHACYGCPVGCKRVVKVDEGPFKMPEGPGPEYETVASFGTMLFIDSLPAVAKMGELCNKYGMDTISCGCTIAFAMECFEKGLISSSDTDGLDLGWGNAQAVVKLVEMIAKREGFGDLLAEGSRQASRRIGKNSADFLVEVKGLEAPMHDPRGFHGMGLAYAVSNRGACHVNSMSMWVEQGYVFYPKIGLGEAYEGQTSEGKAFLNLKTQDIGSIFNSASICLFIGLVFSEDDIVQALNVTTGFGYDLDGVMLAGERIWTLKRGINNLLGISARDDRLPRRILTPASEGNAAGSVPDIGLMLKEFYQLRGLDADGRPTREKLASLSLDDLAEKLYGEGG